MRAELLAEAIELHRAGNLPEAERRYRQLLRADPLDVDALHLLGVIAQQAGRHETAIDLMRRAIEQQPGAAAMHGNLGSALGSLGRHEEAIASFERALAIDPAQPELHCRIGHSRKNLGQTEAARLRYERALELNRNCGEAWKGLSDLAARGAYRFDDEQLEHLHRLADDGSQTSGAAARIGFALADELDRRGAYDEAFAACERANLCAREHLRTTGHSFDAAAHVRQVDAIAATCDAEFFERGPANPERDERPVFIVGMPRSGTTLVEQIVSAHPKVYGAGELKHLNAIAVDLPARLGGEERFPECLGRLDGATARQVSTAHLEFLASIGGEATRVVDKMPGNFLYLGLIWTLFPAARVIHCRRDLRDVGLSCFRQNLQLPWTTRLDDLACYCRQYERLMGHWRDRLPLSLHEVRYEALVDDQAAVSRRLIDWLGLDWNERCLAFYENPRPVRTASKLQVRQPIYTTAIGRWERYADGLRPLLEALDL